MAISDYSTTAASNTSISGIDITGTTGKVKDGDNAIRQIMADIKAGVPYLSGTNYLMESTDAGATAGPVLEFYRNSATPAATRSPPSNATAVNTRGETVSKQTGTFYNPDTNKFEQRTVYR